MKDQENRKTGYGAWIMFSILISAYFFVYFHRMSLAVVGGEIIEEVGGTLGVLSSVYFWTYAAMQIPCGVLSDRFGPRKVSFVFLSVAAAGSALTAAGETFGMMVAGKIMISAGMAAVYIPLMKTVAVWFPSRYFPQLNGIIIAVGNIGAIAASVPLEYMVFVLGWRDTFSVLAVLTLIIALLCFSFIRDPGTEKAETEKIPMLAGLKEVFAGGRKFWPMALAYFFVYGSIMVFQGTWAKIYFVSAYGFAVWAAWIIASIGIGKVLSTVAAGIMAGRGIIKSKRRAMLAGTVCFAAVWLIIWLFAGEMNSPVFWTAVGTAFGFFGGFMSLSFSQVKEWYPVSLAGTSVAAMNVFLFLGASVATTVAGAIIGTTYTLSNFSAVWCVMFAAAATAAICVYFSKEKQTFS